MSDQGTGILSPWLRNRRIEAVRPYIQGRVLDFGCGTGMLSEVCVHLDYTGFDVDPDSLEIARRNYPTRRFINQLPHDELFDTILLLAVIEHVPDCKTCLDRLGSLLAPDGHIVITTPHPWTKTIYTLGSKIRLFSREAEEEHESLVDCRDLDRIAGRSGFAISTYKRFLLGANQLFVLRSIDAERYERRS